MGRLHLTTGKWLSPADVLGEARGARLINDGRGLKGRRWLCEIKKLKKKRPRAELWLKRFPVNTAGGRVVRWEKCRDICKTWNGICILDVSAEITQIQKQHLSGQFQQTRKPRAPWFTGPGQIFH